MLSTYSRTFQREVFQPPEFKTLLWTVMLQWNSNFCSNILKTKYYRVPCDADNWYCKKSQPSTSTETGSLQILISHNQGQLSRDPFMQ